MTLKEKLYKRLSAAAAVVDALPDNPSEAQIWAVMFSLEDALALVIKHDGGEIGTKSRA